jgi:hypothetical protein
MSKALRVIAWMVLLGLVGCSNSGPQSPADHSLSVEEYIRDGMPPVDRPWSAKDFGMAYSEILTRSQRDPGQLPRYQSPRSGAIFARMTAVENLEPFKDKSKPLDTRIPQGLEYYKTLPNLVRIYAGAHEKGAVGDSEIIELTGHMLRGSVVLLGLIDEFLSTVDKNDGKYANRMKGLALLKQGISTTLSGALVMLTEAQLYRASERIRLIGYLTETLPDLFGGMTPVDRANLVGQIQKFNNETRSADLQPALRELEALASELLKKVPPE